MTTSTSRPAMAARTASACPARKRLKPKWRSSLADKASARGVDMGRSGAIGNAEGAAKADRRRKDQSSPVRRWGGAREPFYQALSVPAALRGARRSAGGGRWRKMMALFRLFLTTGVLAK